MASKGTLTVRVIGDNAGLKKSLNDSTRGLADFGKKVAVAGAAVAAGAVAIGAKVLTMGAGFEDLERKAATVFEGQLGSAQTWAQAQAGAMGLTSRELLGLTANFADLLKPMGFTAEQATAMAQETNQLSGALAKWSGGQKTAAEVSEILAKAMLGERDGLKALGISISEADVQARLAVNGTNELTGAALEQAKAVATQQLIVEKSTDAQLAWADGQDDLSVRINQAKASVLEFRDNAVAKLLPVVVAASEKFLEWGTAIAERLMPVIQNLKAWWDTNGPAIIATVLTMWRKVTEAFDKAATFVGEVVDRIRAFIDGFRDRLDQNSTEVTGWFDKAKAIFAQIVETIRVAFEAIRVVFDAVVTVLTELWDRFGTHLVDFAGRVFGRMAAVISEAFDIIKGLFDLVIGILTGDWSRAWEAIKSIVSSAFGILQNLVSNAFDVLKTAFGLGVAGISQIWSGLWDGIKSGFKAAINWIIDKWNALKFTLPTATFMGKSIGGGTIGVPRINRLHTGGVFRAPRQGGEGLALLRDREEVLTPAEAAAQRAKPADRGGTFNIVVNMPPGSDGNDVVRALQQWTRRNGPMPVAVA